MPTRTHKYLNGASDNYYDKVQDPCAIVHVDNRRFVMKEDSWTQLCRPKRRICDIHISSLISHSMQIIKFAFKSMLFTHKIKCIYMGSYDNEKENCTQLNLMNTNENKSYIYNIKVNNTKSNSLLLILFPWWSRIWITPRWVPKARNWK